MSFGCLVFPYLKAYVKHKLESRSTYCDFLGYAPPHKGYLCLELSSGKVIISMHLSFMRIIFLFFFMKVLLNCRKKRNNSFTCCLFPKILLILSPWILCSSSHLLILPFLLLYLFLSLL